MHSAVGHPGTFCYATEQARYCSKTTAVLQAAKCLQPDKGSQHRLHNGDPILHRRVLLQLVGRKGGRGQQHIISQHAKLRHEQQNSSSISFYSVPSPLTEMEAVRSSMQLLRQCVGRSPTQRQVSFCKSFPVPVWKPGGKQHSGAAYS
jgi:hypothetical protein